MKNWCIGERKLHVWWSEFKIQPNFAFDAYSRVEGRSMHSEHTKLRIFDEENNVDFLNSVKASISTDLTAIPLTIIYDQALATFRQEVNIKFPLTMTGLPTSRIHQLYRTDGCGR